MDSLQISLLLAGGVTLLAVVLYNQWVSRKNQPRQPDSAAQVKSAQAGAADAQSATDPLDLTDPTGLIEPVLQDDFHNLPQPERRALLHPHIDAITTIEVDHPVSGDAALAALPATRRIGTKPFHVEGCSELSGEWEPLSPGRRYSAFQAGVQLVNRMGPLNEIEFSEFVLKTQNFADAVGGSPSHSDMLEEVARARELDQFAHAHDAQLSLTLQARTVAWSPGFIAQHAARLGFVAGVLPGRLVLPASVPGMPALLSLTFDAQAALAEDPSLTAVRECVLSLDVPQVPSEEQAFERLQHAAQALAQQMDGLVTDGAGQTLAPQVMAQIGQDLQQLYAALQARELPAGSLQARRLFS